jgi:hypothetical protein
MTKSYKPDVVPPSRLVLASQTRVGHLAALSKDKNLLPTRSRRSHMPVLTPREWRDLPPEERWDTRGGRYVQGLFIIFFPY